MLEHGEFVDGVRWFDNQQTRRFESKNHEKLGGGAIMRPFAGGNETLWA
jgi:hypothetical protein